MSLHGATEAGGLYNDEGTTGILMENNLVYRTKSGGYHQHYGRENIIRNNILALAQEYQIKRSRVEEHLSFTLERNLIFWDQGELLHGFWDDNQVAIHHNLYWQAANTPFDFAGHTLEEWQASGKGTGSIIADPLFIDPAKGDFRLKENSPASKVGFKPFDFSKAGVYGDPKWIDKAKALPTPSMTPPPAVPLLEFFEDFEFGNLPVTSKVSKDDKLGGITVEKTKFAKSGTRAMRFQDTAGQKQRYFPLLGLEPHHTKGTTRCAFQVRLGKDAVFQHEWRDSAKAYRTGPTLWFEDGILRTQTGDLMKIPRDQWIGIEIAAALGDEAGTWDLVVSLPNAEPRHFEKLPLQNPEWRSLDWLGFVSQASEESEIWIDDLELRITDPSSL